MTELYLVLASCYLLAERHGARFLLLINLKNSINRSEKVKYGTIISGLVLIAGLCLLPMDPGPMVLGDLIPEADILILQFFFLKHFFNNDSYESIVNKKRDTLGYITLGVAVLHFLFPGVVLL